MRVEFPRLYAIIDSAFLTTSELDLAKALAGAGVELIQYRNKTASSRSLYQTCLQLSQKLADSRARFIVNDRPDIALLTSAGGVHVGQEDLSVQQARDACGEGRWVGISTHTLEQLAEADRTPADYIAFGPIFSTTTKLNPDPLVGIELLQRARQLTSKPLVAIGGITRERAADVYRAGADSIAVARDLICAADPAACAREYLELAGSAKRLDRR